MLPANHKGWSSDSDGWTKLPGKGHNLDEMQKALHRKASLKRDLRSQGAQITPYSAPMIPSSETDQSFEGGTGASLGPIADALCRTLQVRHIAAGKAMLDSAEAALANLNPDDPDAARLLLLVAQWVDVGYRDHHFLNFLLLRVPAERRKCLPIGDYLRLRMAEAYRALSTEDAVAAIESLDVVLKMGRDLPDDSLEALAHFWKGRAHRKKGEYETALLHIVRAREIAQKSHDELFTAVIQVQESWLLFQQGMRREALRLLTHAEHILQGTDHFVVLGNIESARGRIVRRSGEYARALEHFDRSIAIYAKADPNHLNLARALVNAAYVRRLLALQLRKKIDAQCRSGVEGKSAGTDVGNLRSRHQQICHDAILDLRRARQIYDMHSHLGGTGNVVFNLGYLHLDRGDIDRAREEAAEAYRIGFEKNDRILMARARILQSAAENAHVEEQLGEDVDLAVYANRAREHSEEALNLARDTQNRRLVAGAWIARGITAANEFFQDWEEARRCASEAASLMDAGDNDHLTEELASLKSRVVQASGIADMLRSWSEGTVGDKTFQQITEEFAEIVIPKVWLREERRISRVAERLSVSPKKVRRILRNAGYLQRG